MSRKLDTTTDFAAVVDHLQAVTLVRPGSSLSLSIDGALRTSTSNSTAQAKLGKYEQHDAVWHLPATIPDFTPDLGDEILDAEGRRWTVLAFRRTLDGARWWIVARDMVTAHRLNDFLDIDQATYQLDSRACSYPVWEPWRTGLPARLEVQTVEFQREKEPIGTVREMVVHLSEPLTIDSAYRFRHADGRTFRIVRCRPYQEFGATFQVEVVEIL